MEYIVNNKFNELTTAIANELEKELQTKVMSREEYELYVDAYNAYMFDEHDVDKMVLNGNDSNDMATLVKYGWSVFDLAKNNYNEKPYIIVECDNCLNAKYELTFHTLSDVISGYVLPNLDGIVRSVIKNAYSEINSYKELFNTKIFDLLIKDGVFYK